MIAAGRQGLPLVRRLLDLGIETDAWAVNPGGTANAALRPLIEAGVREITTDAPGSYARLLVRGRHQSSEGEIPLSDAVRIALEAPVKPNPPISSRDVAWEDTGEGTRFGGRAKHLTYAVVGRDYRIGILIEAPAPGMRFAPMHYHMLEEEHALISKGR